MFLFAKYNLDAPFVDSIALSQIPLSGIPLILNGVLGDNPSNTAILNKKGFSRYVTLTSTSDFSSVPFTITGYQNNKIITAVVNGPNNNLVVADTTLFDVISSITCTAEDPIEGSISVGTASALGGEVYSVPILVDSPRGKNISALISVYEESKEEGFGATYNLYGSLENITKSNKSISEMIGKELIKITELTVEQPYFNITASYQCVVLEVIPSEDAYPATVLTFSQEG